eukprot:CAMPEP_0115836328 /NCGR_PEP_ID=MMETSP0287-20121206/4651_1 /TAXON_ID=412157 /ORGANISM="Chrysochromulina rotalis, Strain UIO044" /LENGTH=93 /DNA_ID=CAMNT_0003289809 /DNA_START=244 /DNA_END=525 /DNA_ORIENTATION=+
MDQLGLEPNCRTSLPITHSKARAKRATVHSPQKKEPNIEGEDEFGSKYLINSTTTQKRTATESDPPREPTVVVMSNTPKNFSGIVPAPDDSSD